MLSAPQNWFNQNPANRIVYLLTKDQTIVDNELIRSVFTLLDTCFITLIVIASLNYFYLGALLVFTIVIGVMVYSINYRFSRVS